MNNALATALANPGFLSLCADIITGRACIARAMAAYESELRDGDYDLATGLLSDAREMQAEQERHVRAARTHLRMAA